MRSLIRQVSKDAGRSGPRATPGPGWVLRPGKSHVGAVVVTLLAVALAATPRAAQAGDLAQKVEMAHQVWSELFEVPDRAVPQGLVERSRCVAVIPRIYKGAFGVGGRHGRGILTCRDQQGTWSPPTFVKLSGGSFGFQVGFEASDLVLFFLTEGSVLSLLESKITLGGDASVAAGPAGRTASATTDLKLRAEIYAYAKAKGLFAGVSVEGARLAPAPQANYEYYGRWVPPKSILFDNPPLVVPPEARAFLAALP